MRIIRNRPEPKLKQLGNIKPGTVVEMKDKTTRIVLDEAEARDADRMAVLNIEDWTTTEFHGSTLVRILEATLTVDE